MPNFAQQKNEGELAEKRTIINDERGFWETQQQQQQPKIPATTKEDERFCSSNNFEN